MKIESLPSNPVPVVGELVAQWQAGIVEWQVILHSPHARLMEHDARDELRRRALQWLSRQCSGTRLLDAGLARHISAGIKDAQVRVAVRQDGNITGEVNLGGYAGDLQAARMRIFCALKATIEQG